MKRTTWYWIIGLALAVLLICGGLVTLGLWASAMGGKSSGITLGDAVAIVRVEGTIVPGEAPPPSPFGVATGMSYSEQVIDWLKKAEENPGVKAIILYVDSPGGSVFASDEIYRQLKQMTKPVITAMGSMAASGGYYVAAPTQEIWAGPHTLTCSIGVISQFLNVEEFAQEYGITAITIKSGSLKDTGNPFREFTQEDQALWQSIVDEAYGDFVSIVAEGRSMTEEEVLAIADGRVCSGQQAKEMGLVDALGYLPDVIKRAGELGGIVGEPQVIEYEDKPGFWDALGVMFNRPSPVEELKQLMNFHSGSPLMYLYIAP